MPLLSKSLTLLAALVLVSVLPLPATSCYALDGGPLRVIPRNGWRAFEVIFDR